MRTTRDLVQELAEEATQLTGVAITVGFEKETKFVWYDAPDQGDPLAELNALVEAGGEPIGLVGFLKLPGEIRLYQRALTEYAEEPWVHDYLDSLMEVVRQVAEKGGMRTLRVRPEEN